MARIKTHLGKRPGHRTPWSYRSGTTALHRCPAGIKLILLLLLSAASFFGPLFAAGAGVLILTGAFTTKIKLRELISGSLPLIVMLLVFSLFRAVYLDEGVRIKLRELEGGLLLAINIYVCFLSASLFFAVTTSSEIRGTISAIELFLFRRKSRLGLALALMIGFLPRFFESWENTKLAVKARCCKNRFRQIVVILPLVTERLIETAAETAEALESRGFEY